MFRSALHTSFVVDNVLRLSRNDLDGSKGNNKYPDDFFVRYTDIV